MTFRECGQLWWESRRVVRAAEARRLEERISALELKARGLEAQAMGHSESRLLEQVNGLKAQVDKLSSRLIGFSKTGIS